MTETFAERHGITRNELRERVQAARVEQLERDRQEQNQVLLDLGREFREERQEARQVQARKTVAAMERTPPPPSRPSLTLVGHDDDCTANYCTNVATEVVVRVINGRPFRVRYCRLHAFEVQLEQMAAAN